MKTVELRRHSYKTGFGDADLSKKGIAHATQLGWEALHGKGYTHLYVSTLKRTHQTMKAFAQGAGDFPDVEPEVFPLHVSISQMPEAMQLWTGPCHNAEKRGQDMLQCALEMEHAAATEISRKAAEAFKKWVHSLPDGANALVVGHSPFLEMIALDLFDKRLAQLQPTQGFRVTEEDGQLSLKELR